MLGECLTFKGMQVRERLPVNWTVGMRVCIKALQKVPTKTWHHHQGEWATGWLRARWMSVGRRKLLWTLNDRTLCSPALECDMKFLS